jgi:uncharacterized repeat protein (TIGR01451 family)
LSAAAEVTLTTMVEKISSPVPASDDAAATPTTAGLDGSAGAATAASPVSAGLAPAPAGPPSEVFSGDVLRYTITFENTSAQDVAPGSVVITNPLPEETLYLEGSALGEDTLVTFSVDGTTFASPADLLVGEGAATRAATASDFRAIRWTYEPLLPAGASSQVSFELLIP